MQVPDQESPEQSLGDCAICMDAIIMDRSFLDEKGEGSLLSKGALWAQGARKNYSLAPCHHLFVSRYLLGAVWVFDSISIVNFPAYGVFREGAPVCIPCFETYTNNPVLV